MSKVLTINTSWVDAYHPWKVIWVQKQWFYGTKANKLCDIHPDKMTSCQTETQHQYVSLSNCDACCWGQEHEMKLYDIRDKYSKVLLKTYSKTLNDQRHTY